MHKLYDFMEARERLNTVITKTKLIHSSIFSNETGNEVYIKPENLQRTGAFKIRGAYNKIAKLTEEEKKRGVIAASAGNHAQGVALAAQKLGIKAVIVMPKHTPLIKVEATRRYGAEVILTGEVYDEAYEYAKKLQEKEGYTFVHPFNDEDVIEGQGTIALEVLEELPDADIILVPIGGGGLISGIALAAKLKNPMIKIIGVEPEGAASAIAALKNGGVVELPEANTIADGTAVRRIGDLNFDYIKNYVDDIITINDNELIVSFLDMVENHKMIVENSGLLTVAALKHLDVKGKKIVAILSGGNMDVITMASLIQHGLIARDRIFTVSVLLPDKPGELAKVADLLASERGNVIKLEHNQFISINRNAAVELRITIEAYGTKHKEQIVERLNKEGYRPKLVRSKGTYNA